MQKHPLPEEGIGNKKDINELLESMIKDQNIPMNDIGDVKLKPGEQKNKRFKFHNDTGEVLELEVFSNIPNYIEVTTPTLKIDFNQETQSGSEFIKFVISAPYMPSESDVYIMIFKKEENKLVPLELFKFKLQTG